MQQGLSIGLGAWIDRQHGQGGRPALPAAPIPFRLSHFGELSDPEDLVRAIELSLLANRLEHGWQQGAGGVPVYLWDRHRQVIGTMESAVSTLSQAQREALAAADAVLYGPDGFSISDRYAMYDETRRIHEDLVLAGAAPADVQIAFGNWVSLGHKQEVEMALATKTTLERGTSRLIAASDVTRIDVALDSLGGDTPFVPTLFTPLSAVSPDFWTEAEVDFQALEDAIPPEIPRTAWARFRARKSGSVRFRFVAVDLQRGWFSPEIYAADDWRTATPVADGQGGQDDSGSLPSYYARLYLAQVLDLNSGAVPVASPPAKPTVGFIQLPPAVLSNRLQAATVSARVKPVFATVKPSLAKARIRPDGRHAGAAAGKSRGVSLARPTSLKAATVSAVALQHVVAGQRVSRLELKPHIRLGVHGRMSKIQSLTASLAISKLTYAQAHLTVSTPAAPPAAPPAARPAYLVGFGRANLPACPNPNPNYQWP